MPAVHSRPLQSYEIHDDLHDAHPPVEEMLANLTLQLRAGEAAPDASAVDGATLSRSPWMNGAWKTSSSGLGGSICQPAATLSSC